MKSKAAFKTQTRLSTLALSPFVGQGSPLGAEAGPGEASAHLLLLAAASPRGLVSALAAFAQRGLGAGDVPGRCVAA